jgi:hypothetical protein
MIQEYAEILQELEIYAPQIEGIVCAGEDDEESMVRAKDGYAVINGIYKKAEEVRKQAKAEAKRETDAIDSIGRVLKGVIDPMLEHLKAQRDYKKLAEAKRQAEIDRAEAEELKRLRAEKEAIHWENLQKEKARAAELAKENEALKAEISKAPASTTEPPPPPPPAPVQTKCTCPNCGYQFDPEGGF